MCIEMSGYLGTSRIADVTIAVVHLAWAGIGDEHLERFATSYRRHHPGAEHALIIAWKGYSAERLAHARRCLDGIDYEDEEVKPEPLDLDSYREIASRLTADAVCFLNSYSEIVADQWLAKLENILNQPGVGLVGASGSYESPLADRVLPRRWARRGRFAPFPNPHLRTNGFMLELELMRELDWPPINDKAEAWALECGVNGITRQVEGRNLKVLVVGRDGRAYPAPEWPASQTFRSGSQTNLMVADNRTQQYAEATGRFRRRLEHLAWGAGR
jgi:hypothetical protein